jgi:hypothetical protein
VVLEAMSTARETRHLEAGHAGEILLGLVELAGFLHQRVAALS